MCLLSESTVAFGPSLLQHGEDSSAKHNRRACFGQPKPMFQTCLLLLEASAMEERNLDLCDCHGE